VRLFELKLDILYIFLIHNERKNRKWVLIGYACYYPIELLFIPLCK